jgi:tRNA dimethylallyltransferase
MSSPKLAILGPTASGKSGIAVRIAKEINGTVINGDPFQAFMDIPVGTGQPRHDERQRVPHIGYGVFTLDRVLNPATFGATVREWVAAAQNVGSTPILVTGSGLYLRGIWDQLDALPCVPERIVQKVRRLGQRLGSQTLHRYLHVVDPDRASRLHPNDASRVQRAIALHIGTSKQPSALLTSPSNAIPMDWQIFMIMPRRESMKERIATRVKKMIESGWRQEVQRIEQSSQVAHLRRLRPLGYDVLLDEPIPDAAVQKIVQATQAYAKRQVTWFKNQMPDEVRIDPDGEDPCTVVMKRLG